MTEKSIKTLNALIEKHESMRAFSRLIGEDSADVSRWKGGHKEITVRAVISICRIFGSKPSDFNPIFPTDIEFVFKKSK